MCFHRQRQNTSVFPVDEVRKVMMEVVSLKISYLKLWKLLLDKKLKKTDLLKLADISTTTLAKLSKNQSVGMDVLLRICKALSCDIADIVETIPDENDKKDKKEN
jgi:DNA-binding Xre family transcriptional regulator